MLRDGRMLKVRAFFRPCINLFVPPVEALRPPEAMSSAEALRSPEAMLSAKA